MARHTAQAATNRQRVEIDEQTGIEPANPKISNELCGVYWEQSLDGFDFDHQSPFDDEVHTVAVVEGPTFVGNGKGLLSFETKTAKRQLVTEALFVDGFQQSGPEHSMHLDARGDDHGGTIGKLSRHPP